ncbi:hypothetical protein GBAR_LOCUS15531 [Geodia barretti]|uniref:Uncharacterized protein n=1 Tax=Geodia barretti TaxID=519541 RepID=A0AA35WNP4_GEOBA|nr:hypothetical protein GBAR_LOCUS15531 [Geodia barretti]
MRIMLHASISHGRLDAGMRNNFHLAQDTSPILQMTLSRAYDLSSWWRVVTAMYRLSVSLIVRLGVD